MIISDELLRSTIRKHLLNEKVGYEPVDFTVNLGREEGGDGSSFENVKFEAVPTTQAVSIAEKELGDFNVDMTVSSNLSGFEFDFPEPFAKNKEDKKSFQIGFKHIDDSLAYSIEYDELFNAIVIPE